MAGMGERPGSAGPDPGRHPGHPPRLPADPGHGVGRAGPPGPSGWPSGCSAATGAAPPPGPRWPTSWSPARRSPSATPARRPGPGHPPPRRPPGRLVGRLHPPGLRRPVAPRTASWSAPATTACSTRPPARSSAGPPPRPLPKVRSARTATASGPWGPADGHPRPRRRSRPPGQGPRRRASPASCPPAPPSTPGSRAPGPRRRPGPPLPGAAAGPYRRDAGLHDSGLTRRYPGLRGSGTRDPRIDAPARRAGADREPERASMLNARIAIVATIVVGQLWGLMVALNAWQEHPTARSWRCSASSCCRSRSPWPSGGPRPATADLAPGPPRNAA